MFGENLSPTVRAVFRRIERRSNVDEGIVVRFQSNADFLFQDAIRADKQPVASVGQHLSTQARTFKRAANCGIVTPRAAWRRAYVARRSHKAVESAQKLAPERLRSHWRYLYSS